MRDKLKRNHHKSNLGVSLLGLPYPVKRYFLVLVCVFVRMPVHSMKNASKKIGQALIHFPSSVDFNHFSMYNMVS